HSRPVDCGSVVSAGLVRTVLVLTCEYRDRPGSAGLVWEERARMASPDAIGWPDEAAGFSSGSARAEYRVVGVGLGWAGAQRGHVGSGQAGGGGGRGGASGLPAGSQAMGKAGSEGQEQAFAQASRAGARDQPARVRQALSAVSRETNARNLSAREEAQGSGTV